jgi:hypothetical protein
MNPIYSLVELRQSHHYYHHFSTFMVLLVYGYLVYFIAAALTITFLYLLSCKDISHTRIVVLVLFSRWCKCLVCVELYQRLIELERTFILPLAPRWVRHSYLSKGLHTIPYTCGISILLVVSSLSSVFFTPSFIITLCYGFGQRQICIFTGSWRWYIVWSNNGFATPSNLWGGLEIRHHRGTEEVLRPPGCAGENPPTRGNKEWRPAWRNLGWWMRKETGGWWRRL